MAEHKLKKADGTVSEEKPQAAVLTQAKESGSAAPKRILAVVFWVLALGFEVLALLVYLGKVDLKFVSQIVQLIAFLVLDLACVITGSQFWKKANRIDPASKKSPVKFWLWNNMGVIVPAIAFIPFIILALTDKNADKKTKTIAVVAAVIALLLGGVASYDFNPVSEEEKQEAVSTITGDVFWAPFGRVYHMDEDCSALNRSGELTYGTVDQAIAANRTRLCSFCARRHSITNVVTDNVEISDDMTETRPDLEELDLTVPENAAD